MNVQVMRSGETIGEGNQEDIREYVEDILSARLSYIVSLQEEIEDGTYTLCLHSDTYDGLTDDQIEDVEGWGITLDPETTTPAICKLLDLSFHVV